MGEYLTADMLLAMREINELLKENDSKEFVEAANFLLALINSELSQRPGYNVDEVERIKKQIYENFGRKGYLSRSIICVSLLKQAYSLNNPNPKFNEYLTIVEEKLKTKREIIRESEGQKR